MCVGMFRRFQNVLNAHSQILCILFPQQVKVNTSTTCLFRYRDKVDGTAVYTLQMRMVEYLRSDDKYKGNTFMLKPDYSVMGCAYNKLQFRKTLQEIPEEHLPQFIYNLNHYKNILDSKAFNDIVQQTDAECCIRLRDMYRHNVLKSFDAWFYVLSQRITHLKFYSLFVEETFLWVSSNRNTIEDLLQPIFYIGLQKRTEKARNIINKCLNNIDSTMKNDISLEELCILTNAAFKTSTKITSTKILSMVCHAINTNLNKLLLDEALFITLIKSLRHAQYHNFDMMNSIANSLVLHPEIVKNLNFTAKVHLLALYADSLYAKDDLINLIIDLCINDLSLASFKSTKKSDHLSIMPRIKDITRFLWAISYLDCHLDDYVIDIAIIPYLSNRHKNGKYASQPEEMINSLLSLWIMGYNAKELFKEAVTSEAMESLEKKNRLRYNSRLSLLIKCIEIEMPTILRKEHHRWKPSEEAKRDIKKTLENRKMLQDVYLALTCISSHLQLGHITCDFFIPHLNIAGITVRHLTGCVLHIEVLDPTVCLHMSEKPHGLMKLKLRLLKALGCKVLTISNKQMVDLPDVSALNVFLEDELFKYTRQL